MNKSELVSAIADRTGVDKGDVDATLQGLFEVVATTVAKGEEKISIPGFISFAQGHRGARTGRNPQTNEPMEIAASKTVKVTPGAKLKAIAAGKEAPPS